MRYFRQFYRKYWTSEKTSGLYWNNMWSWAWLYKSSLEGLNQCAWFWSGAGRMPASTASLTVTCVQVQEGQVGVLVLKTSLFLFLQSQEKVLDDVLHFCFLRLGTHIFPSCGSVTGAGWNGDAGISRRASRKPVNTKSVKNNSYPDMYWVVLLVHKRSPRQIPSLTQQL